MRKKEDLIYEGIDFNYIELTALCEYLENKERAGLRLKKIDFKDFVFEPSNKRSIRYSAVLYGNPLLKKDFIASCEAEGWEYVASYLDELYIFRTQDPDATEIITDEKENFRTVTKRFLLRPSFLGFSIVFVNTIIRIPLFISRRSVPLAVDDAGILWCFLLVGALVPIFIKTSDFITWYIKAKKCVRNGESIPFVNLAERKKIRFANNIAYSVDALICTVIYIYLFLGYTKEKWLFVTVGICLSVLISAAVYSKAKANALLLSVLSFAIVCAGTFGLYLSFDKAYKENSERFINNNGIPVSLSDFGFDEKYCEDETSIFQATRFGQYYSFSSNNVDGDGFLWYDVFVSDSTAIRNQYINMIIEKYEKYSNELTTYQTNNSDWDSQYRECYKGEIREEGYAVKGNTVVRLEFCSADDGSGADFFDIAYEKLFGETE